MPRRAGKLRAETHRNSVTYDCLAQRRQIERSPCAACKFVCAAQDGYLRSSTQAGKVTAVCWNLKCNQAGSKIWRVSDIQLRKFGMKTVPEDFAIPDGD
ncbi:unnamed protein product [Heterotrigona itama]|uniref:Uncharacterized protein n=1 Tax=Heterotrigona itama TaxID=395501 RepID=A0A6V7HFS3_9HYME|nr:unnamed protein product [Heterotrigona itama]